MLNPWRGTEGTFPFGVMRCPTTRFQFGRKMQFTLGNICYPQWIYRTQSKRKFKTDKDAKADKLLLLYLFNCQIDCMVQTYKNPKLIQMLWKNVKR